MIAERRKNCAVFHTQFSECMKRLEALSEWVNGNGKPGAKERIGNVETLNKINLSLTVAVLLAIIGLYLRG